MGTTGLLASNVNPKRLYCGTSGFAYPSWKPAFYPEKLASSKFLAHYGTRLNAVEVNYSYRKLVAASTFEKWIAATPEGFLFLPKAHMKITHSLKLKDAGEFTQIFANTLAPLAEAGRLGPLLFQLPPSLKADQETLKEFLDVVPKSITPAFEFRHASWFDESIYDILRNANAALCLAENEKLETPKIQTANFMYLRLRKPDYTSDDIDAFAQQVQAATAAGRTTYAIFKHEESPAGALNAEKLLGMTSN